MAQPNSGTNDELSQEELSDMSGGVNQGRSPDAPQIKSRDTTSFSELSKISLNLTGDKKKPKKDLGQD